MMLEVDGSMGEGGGQIVRSALALSMVTGKPVHIDNIRAGRSKPGLMRQHLTAVRAAVAISSAKVQGDATGSTQITFEPGTVQGGEHTFAVGTAGSATLVLQTILPALLTVKEPSTLTLEGGTHNPFAPPFDFLARVFLPLVNRMGPRVTVTLDRHGFYPAGGGRFTVRIEPVPQLKGIQLLERGRRLHEHATAIVCNLHRSIAQRELTAIGTQFNWPREQLHVQETKGASGPGNVVMIELASEHVTELFTGFGEAGRSAEAVAEQAITQCRRYLASDAPAGEYLTDQLLLPLALAGSGGFRSVHLSRHATTHIGLIHQFLNVRVEVEEHGGDKGCTLSISA